MTTLLLLAAVLGYSAPTPAVETACDLLAVPITCSPLLVQQPPTPTAVPPARTGRGNSRSSTGSSLSSQRFDLVWGRADRVRPGVRRWNPGAAAPTGGDSLCDGDFSKNCRNLAMTACDLSVSEIKASVSGTVATCRYSCGGLVMPEEQKKSCDMGLLPIAACIFPACPENCMTCVELTGELECWFGISDDPDPVGSDPDADAEESVPRWICE